MGRRSEQIPQWRMKRNAYGNMSKITCYQRTAN